MFGTQNLLLFVTSGILLNLTPGQDTFYIVGRSIAQGRSRVLGLRMIFERSGTKTQRSASSMSRRLRENPSGGSMLRRAAGAMFVGLGAKLAVSK